MSPALQADSLPAEPQGKPFKTLVDFFKSHISVCYIKITQMGPLPSASPCRTHEQNYPKTFAPLVSNFHIFFTLFSFACSNILTGKFSIFYSLGKVEIITSLTLSLESDLRSHIPG